MASQRSSDGIEHARNVPDADGGAPQGERKEYCKAVDAGAPVAREYGSFDGRQRMEESRDAKEVKRRAVKGEGVREIDDCRIQAPGDIVMDLTRTSKTTLRLGGGLRQDLEYVLVTKAGRFKYTKPNKYWVEGSQKRYIPNVEDVVIAVVVDRRFDNFIVDIGAPGLASLPVLSFEGASRRNIPNIQTGSLLYLRVVKAHRDMTPELSSTDAAGKASGFGPLKNGYVFECSTGLARALMSRPTYPVLDALGNSLSFEIAVGLNGRVWVNSASPSTTILVSNAIINAEFMSVTQQRTMVQKLLQRVQ